MKIFKSVVYALGVLGAAAILAACSSGGSQSQVGPSGPTQIGAQSGLNSQPLGLLSAQPVKSGVAMTIDSDHGKSWMSPDAKRAKKLLYISDSGTNDVYVYSYPKHKLLGTLTGFNEPQGECVQGKNVWITNANNYNAATLLEYTAGGTSPIATITDPDQDPVSCSYDKTTGDLAVSNLQTNSGGAGSVSIYSSPSGTPVNYAVTTMTEVWFLGYDTSGNLFVDGTDINRDFQLAELVKGTTSFTALTLSGATVEKPGGIQYADGALAVGDRTGSADYGIIYQTNVSGSTATVTGSTDLTKAPEAFQYFIDKSTVIVPSIGQGAATTLYAYPAGGGPKRTISGTEPIGSAVIKN
jgi:hypothetical protein